MLDSDPPVPPSDKITPVGDATDIHADRRPQFEYPNAPLPLQSTFYIPRPPIEQQIFDQLRLPGSLTRIRAPQKMGKTSLLFRVIQEAHNLGYATAVVDFQQAEAAILSNLEALIRWFCCHLSRQLGIFTPFDADWQADTGSKLNCTLYIQRQILQRFDCPVVFFLRHLDALLPYPTSTQEFFSLLRGWFEDARWLETWQKLRLVITHSTDIYVPLKLHQSPFNVGLSVHLPEFNVPQIQALAQAYGLPAFTSVQMQALRQLVGGHPYLVAIALYHLAISDLSLDQLLAAASYPNGIYRHHLGSHWDVDSESCIPIKVHAVSVISVWG